MLQHEGNGLCIQAGVERVEHGPGHRHTEVNFQHGRHVGQHHRHRIAFANATGCQGVSQLAAAGVGLAPGLAPLAVDSGHMIGIHLGRALNEAQWRKGDEISEILIQSQLVRIDAAHVCLLLPSTEYPVQYTPRTGVVLWTHHRQRCFQQSPENVTNVCSHVASRLPTPRIQRWKPSPFAHRSRL